MISRISAVAIDDDPAHLSAICEAAFSANITCHPIKFPDPPPDGLNNELIRLVICDLHLNAQGSLSSEQSIFNTVAGVLAGLQLTPFSPYILVIWSMDARDANKLDGLRTFLEERLPPEIMPCAFISLDKLNYGITDNPTAPQKELLWRDLKEKVQNSPGLNLLLQWEREIHRAAGNVVCNLMRTVRSEKGKSVIPIDSEIDLLLTRIARTATSDQFSSLQPRAAAVEGLIPLVSDEMQHLELNRNEEDIWLKGMQKATVTGKEKLPPLTAEQAASLNDAFHVARDNSAVSRPDRGAVLESTETDVLNDFDIERNAFGFTFGLHGKLPKNALIRYVQIEGACDAAQRKKGVVPLILALEVDGNQRLLEIGSGQNKRSASVEETPTFLVEGKPRKLLLNVRYFISLPRDELDKKIPCYRLRDSLVSKLAFAWANHAIRPGIVEFTFAEDTETLPADQETGAEITPRGFLAKLKDAIFH